MMIKRSIDARPNCVRFSLRDMFVATSLASLHLAALGELVRNGGSHGPRAVLLLVAVMTVAFGVTAASARRTAMFRSGLPVAQLAMSRLRTIRLWQSAIVPLVILMLVSYAGTEAARDGEFPIMLLIFTIVTALSAVKAFYLLSDRSLTVCEHGIVAENALVPWHKLERSGWSICQDGVLKLGTGMGQFEAVVPAGQRVAVEEFLQHKLGQPRGN